MIQRLLIVVALLLPAGLWAQPARSFFPWWEMGLTRDLNLSEQQQQQIRDILRQNRTKIIDLRAALEKAEGEVDDLFEEENPDQRHSQEVVDRLIQARGEMTRNFTLLSLQMRRVLTRDQWKELQRRRPGFDNMRRGPGGPGGGGRPQGMGPGRQLPTPQPKPPQP
jgi:Spy/CpxP family protein refolding chaperone